MNVFHLDTLIPVTFRDMDAFGHVNNAVYVSYMETGRVQYFNQVLGIPILPPHLLAASGGPGATEPSIIVADLNLSYRSPATLGETIRVAVRVSRVGNKSFDMEYRLTEAASGRLVGEGKTVQVAYDYGQNCTVPVPQRWRERFAAYDGILVP